MTTAVRHHPASHTSSGDRNHSKPRHAQVAEEAEGIMNKLSLSAVSEEAKELMGRLRKNVDLLKESAEAAQEQIQESFHATEKQIKQHPWMAVGVTSTVGILIGYLLGRRGARE